MHCTPPTPSGTEPAVTIPPLRMPRVPTEAELAAAEERLDRTYIRRLVERVRAYLADRRTLRPGRHRRG